MTRFKNGQILISKETGCWRSLQIVNYLSARGIYKVIYLDIGEKGSITDIFLNELYIINPYNFNTLWQKINV